MKWQKEMGMQTVEGPWKTSERERERDSLLLFNKGVKVWLVSEDLLAPVGRDRYYTIWLPKETFSIHI